MASPSYDSDDDSYRQSFPRERDSLLSQSDCETERHDASERSGMSEKRYQPGRIVKPGLVCTAASVKQLVTLLSCLFQGKKDQRVRCDIDTSGMLFTSHTRGKSLQIKTSLGSELFDTYEFDPSAEYAEDEQPRAMDEDVDVQYSFALNLSAFIESLSMFGPAALPTSSLRLSYFPATACLTLVVEDNGVICECSMQVLELEGNDVGQLEFETAFEHSVVVARCIIQSQPLHDAFAELYDLPSAASVTVTMFSDEAGDDRSLSLSAASETGSCEIDFARTSSAFIEFYCAGDTQTTTPGQCAATFHVAVLQQALKALTYSNETFLRMNADGFLSVQHMIESGSGYKAFVDALISPEDTSIP